MREQIAEWVDKKIREGFYSREDVIEFATEIFEDEFDFDGIRGLVQRETDRLLDIHVKNESIWPEKTDCDKIDSAFSALEIKGIVARQNFACCQNCGNAEIGDEIEEFSKRKEPIGYVFFHEQDTESVIETGTLYFSFGALGGTDEEALGIGENIRDTLQQQGLTVNWNGSLDRRICITGIDWKKRRSPK